MKKLFLLLVLLVPLALMGNILTVTKTDGCNNYGGHNSDPIVDTVDVWSAQAGLTNVVISGDNETWTNLPYTDFCMILFINTSGADVVTTPAEEMWLMNALMAGAATYAVHAAAGDTERLIGGICNLADIWAGFEGSISGCSLNNGGCNSKHECNGNLERVLIVDKTHPITVVLPDSVMISDEFYYTLDGNFSSTNQVLVEIDEDGQSPGNIPIMWLTGPKSLCLTLGHANNNDLPPVADASEWAYSAFKSGFDYMISLTTCGNPVFALPDELEPTVYDVDVTDNGSLITFIDNILTYDQVEVQPYTIFDMGGRVMYRGMAREIDFNNSPSGRYYLKSYNTHFVINKR